MTSCVDLNLPSLTMANEVDFLSGWTVFNLGWVSYSKLIGTYAGTDGEGGMADVHTCGFLEPKICADKT